MLTRAQDAQARKDYFVDWTKLLTGGDTLATSTWTVDEGLTIADESNTTTSATVWLEGGVAGNSYEVVNHVITTAGREDEFTFVLQITDQTANEPPAPVETFNSLQSYVDAATAAATAAADEATAAGASQAAAAASAAAAAQAVIDAVQAATDAAELVGVVSATVDGSDHLILTLGSGATIDAGAVVGPQGDQGLPGDQTPATTGTWTGTVTLPSLTAPGTHRRTLSANATVPALTSGTASFAYTVTLLLKQAASGGPYTITWPAALEWPNDAVGPAMPTVANAELLVHLFWDGAAWRGIPGGVFYP